MRESIEVTLQPFVFEKTKKMEEKSLQKIYFSFFLTLTMILEKKKNSFLVSILVSFLYLFLFVILGFPIFYLGANEWPISFPQSKHCSFPHMKTRKKERKKRKR